MLDATTTLRVATGIAQIQARHPVTASAAQLTLHEAYGRTLPARARRQPRADDRERPQARVLTPVLRHGRLPGGDGGGAVHRRRRARTSRPPCSPPSARRCCASPPSAADGAHPYFSPVEHTAAAREILGPDKLLAPEQMVVHRRRPRPGPSARRGAHDALPQAAELHQQPVAARLRRDRPRRTVDRASSTRSWCAATSTPSCAASPTTTTPAPTTCASRCSRHKARSSRSASGPTRAAFGCAADGVGPSPAADSGTPTWCSRRRRRSLGRPPVGRSEPGTASS